MTIPYRFPFLKEQIINLGIYKPVRWIVDRTISRSRLRANNVRIELLRDLVTPDDLCFDVGANIGDYTASLLAVGARVIAVDPQPSAIKELRARFYRNDRIVVEPVALGDREGKARFFVRDHHGASSFLENWGGGRYRETLELPIRTIESLIKTYGVPSYVKLDVEGYELQVVLGLKSKVNLISVEYFLTDENCASKLEIIEILEKFGTLSFNLVQEGADAFFWPKFVSSETFHSVFPQQLRLASSAFYGDIFVRIS